MTRMVRQHRQAMVKNAGAIAPPLCECRLRARSFASSKDGHRHVRDMHERGRFINAGKLKTHCVRGHLLSGDNVRWGGPRLSYRNCRACCAMREAARPKRTQCETL